MTRSSSYQEVAVVWVIEDSAGLRDTIVDIIGQTDDLCCPVAISSMEETWAVLEHSITAAPDVIVIDLGLPGMGGLEGIPILKTQFPLCEILVFTVNEDDNNIARAVQNGASGYLLKTEKLGRIPDAIREACAGGGPFSSVAGRALADTLRASKVPLHDYGLSPREVEVLQLMTKGLGKKQVAEELRLSYHTIDCYVRGIYKKLKVNSIHGAVGKALGENLI